MFHYVEYENALVLQTQVFEFNISVFGTSHLTTNATFHYTIGATRTVKDDNEHVWVKNTVLRPNHVLVRDLSYKKMESNFSIIGQAYENT